MSSEARKSRGLVIAVSGQAGSGKTTHAKLIAETFSLRYVSTGMIFRSIAKERGISLIELHKLAESDDSIDRYVDEKAKEEALKGNVVVEGHLTAWILRDIADVKIYLKADLRERARRIAERDGKSFEEALREIMFREESNRKRYLKIYGIDICDLSIFDLVIDTTKLPKEAVAKVIRTFIQEYINYIKSQESKD